MRAAKLWPLAVVAVLGSTVVANVALLVVTHGEKSAVEPDYYQKAVHWDSTLASAQRSAELGWSAEVSLAPLDLRGGSTLQVRLVDRAGAPVRDALVRVVAIHNLDPVHPVVGTLAHSEPSGYAALLPLRRSGLWELRLEATRREQRFAANLRADCAPASIDDGTPSGSPATLQSSISPPDSHAAAHDRAAVGSPAALITTP